jgi:hypothetical protein
MHPTYIQIMAIAILVVVFVVVAWCDIVEKGED